MGEFYEVKKIENTKKGFVADITSDDNSICKVLVENDNIMIKETNAGFGLCMKLISNPEIKSKINKLKETGD